MVSLLNSKGYVLEIFGDPEEDRLVKTARGYVGACWDLKNSGNNTASAVVFYKKPVQMFGADVEARPEADREMLARLLNSKMPKNRIAEKMNISRSTLYRRMKQFNLK
jgi:transcriptional regulator of acetoin/glycerol metabolism